MAHYTDTKFDIDDAYKLMPLSKEYLRKIFIQEHGISPSHFLTSKRIALAKQLLLKKNDNNLRISEIAELSGFDDLAYFSRIFKKETGFAPTEYELKHLQTNKIEDKEK
jgi:two-component system response regulator YesN